jgi:hypothetical protein
MLENLESKSGNRRDFLKKTGKQALWMAPTLTVLMTASSQPAQATYKTSGGGTTYKTSGTDNHQEKFKVLLKRFFGWLKSKNH